MCTNGHATHFVTFSYTFFLETIPGSCGIVGVHISSRRSCFCCPTSLFSCSLPVYHPPTHRCKTSIYSLSLSLSPIPTSLADCFPNFLAHFPQNKNTTTEEGKFRKREGARERERERVCVCVTIRGGYRYIIGIYTEIDTEREREKNKIERERERDREIEREEKLEENRRGNKSF